MAKKIEIMDGNQAAAYISYAFTEVAGIFLSLHHPLWLNTWMNGLLTAKRISLASRYKSLKCSLKAVLLVRYTVPFRLAPSPLRIRLPKACC